MNTLISFHLLSLVSTVIDCVNGRSPTHAKTSARKHQLKSLLLPIIGLIAFILICLLLILFYVFYIRKQSNKNRDRKVQRQLKDYAMPNLTDETNDFDTIRTVGTPSEFPDRELDTERHVWQFNRSINIEKMIVKLIKREEI